MTQQSELQRLFEQVQYPGLFVVLNEQDAHILHELLTDYHACLEDIRIALHDAPECDLKAAIVALFKKHAITWP